ncbi:MAG: TIGR02300 family protein [Alphaproteobacteria bacterium]|nr:MAG: TIGR02300 family protein [Alphaproteobacteria bacterium]
MAKPEWGTKRVCQGCGTRFYDFGRTPIVCPKCGEEFDLEALLKSRRPRAAAPAKPAKVAAPVVAEEIAAEAPEAEADIEEIVDADIVEEIPDVEGEGDAVLEDASELGEEDVAVVVAGDESES